MLSLRFNHNNIEVMKNKVFLFTGLLLIFSAVAFSKHIDEQKAKQVGQVFLTGMIGAKTLENVDNFELVYKADANSDGKHTKSNEEVTYFYVFAGTNGFVIVAGDDNVSPILGYSYENPFVADNMPPNLMEWLEGYKNEIRYVVENEIFATAQIRKEWEDYYNGTLPKVHKGTSVSPLISTQWNQNPYYNDLCPGNGSSKTVTGCVATAMAQVMKFWEYPTNGVGFHSYNCSPFGTLSANFAATTYEWSSMPVRLTSSSSNTQKNAVATLMYHCGVSVNMQYDYASNGGSGAYTLGGAPSAEHALKTYFGYKSTLSGKSKSSYSDANWINLLKTELDAGRPMLYAGQGSSGTSGHAFVCDGYDENNKFHFNWGWNGQNDGYFLLTSLNPGSGGAGGGGYNFTYNQRAVIGIEPPQGVAGDTTKPLRLSSGLTMSSASVWFGSRISIKTSVTNYDTSVFNGTLGAAIFNSKGILVDFLSTINVSIPANGGVIADSFARAGGPPFIPGDYYVSIFYKTTDTDWAIVGDGTNSSQRNYREFIIEYAASIETFSEFVIKNNGGRLIQNQSATVNVGMLNTGATFRGKFRVSLSDLNGNNVQVIQIADLADASRFQTDSLKNYSYYAGIDFKGTIEVKPGTYLMVLAFQRSGESSWYYAGSSMSDQVTGERFQNPVFAIVEIGPDMYEPNDSPNQARNLPVNFSMNTATVRTTGSNFHIGTDQDYYKIELPSGYNYTIAARLHDSYNSGNGNVYSANGLFSYSTNEGSTWSDIYDDIMPDSIRIQNGGTVYFHVVPSLLGETGDYLLDMSIRRTASTSIAETVQGAGLKVYPNPTTGQLQVTGYELQENAEYRIYSIVGQVVMQGKLEHEGQIDVSALSSGMYFLKIDNKVVKFVKE